MKIVRNERSWVIDMISFLNIYIQAHHLKIKKVGGESTINTGDKTMFPDLLLYEDESQGMILQGWEVKTPDVSITNSEFIKDAQRKAETLGLSSCMIWNFTSAVLYVKDEQGAFQIVKQWNENAHIQTREDIETYQSDWEELLKEIILELNDFFLHHEVRAPRIETVITENILESLLYHHKVPVAAYLKEKCKQDQVLRSDLNVWWREMSVEYMSDEADMYHAYAKSMLLNWINKITFAHTIKRYHNPARKVEDLHFEMTPKDGQALFEEISDLCNYHHIFKEMAYGDLLTAYTWRELIEFNTFLIENNISGFDQDVIQGMLEQNVRTVKREVAGQFSTPKLLADLLAKVTIDDIGSNVLDCCTGTGTIPKSVLHVKKENMDDKAAYESTWASDKFSFPLQIANLNLTDIHSVNVSARIFQKNVFDIKTGALVDVIDPANGDVMQVEIPEFDVIVSNLPFVKSANIEESEKEHLIHVVEEIQGSLPFKMSARSDLYAYIVIKIWSLLAENGRVGIITSNAWLGTIAGREFYHTLKRLYQIEHVIISGKKRWFQNADVVTTMLVLTKKEKDHASAYDTYFSKLNVPLARLEDAEIMEVVADSIVLKRNLDERLLTMNAYTQAEISDLLDMNISLNALFADVDWLLEVKDKLISSTAYFDVIRGERRGWDKLFYPEDDHEIEDVYLKTVLKSPVNLNSLHAQADTDAFCCSKSIEELEALGHDGALSWIRRFESEPNNKGIPLPKALARKNMYWYEMLDSAVADFTTAISPNRRLFFAKFSTPSFINQRLIGWSVKDRNEDFTLLHALLNSVLGIFYIEAVGFGRGLGVLDLNKDNLEKMNMLNPALLNEEQISDIKSAFLSLLDRDVLATDEELNDVDRIHFDKLVLQAFGIEEYYESIKASILIMQQVRLTAKEK